MGHQSEATSTPTGDASGSTGFHHSQYQRAHRTPSEAIPVHRWRKLARETAKAEIKEVKIPTRRLPV